MEKNGDEITRIAREQEHTIALTSPQELKKIYQGQFAFYKKILEDMGVASK
jgi:hypothetical protein